MKPLAISFASILIFSPFAATGDYFGDFEYTSDGTSITIIGYTGAGGDVVVPDTIGGLPVTSIGDKAFFKCSSLTSVTIPDSVTSIGGLGLLQLRQPDQRRYWQRCHQYRKWGVFPLQQPEPSLFHRQRAITRI